MDRNLLNQISKYKSKQYILSKKIYQNFCYIILSFKYI